METNKIYQGDCLELMKQIEDKNVDLILCDLPYGTTACFWDSVIDLKRLWEEYKRIIRDNGAIVLTASQPFTSALVMSNIKMFKYEWIWEKSKASNFLLAKKQPLKAHENILVFANGTPNYYPQKTQGKPYYRGGIKEKHDNPEVSNNIPNYHSHIRKSEDGMRLPRSVQYFTTAEFDGKFHPTQKPIALFEYLIKTYSKEGNLVLDNCIGAGTTAIACKKNNRNFIGIELEQKYVDICNSRLREIQVSLDVDKKEVAIPPKDKSLGILATFL